MFENDIAYNYMELLSSEEENNIPEYPLPIAIKDIEDCYLIDKNGHKYLDFTSCQENHPLGYIKISEDSNICFDSELFNSYEAEKLENQLKNLTGLEKAYFTSSILECYEISNKLVNSYFLKKQKRKMLVSASCINREKYVINDTAIDFIPLNNDTVAKSLFTKGVGAVIVQLAQITDEIKIADTEYLRFLRDLCDKNNALLVLDVSNISPLRLANDLFNYDISIKPDILIISRGFSQGIPFGAVITSEKLQQENIKKGTSNIAYKQVLKLLDDYQRNNLASIVQSNAKYFEKSLNDLAKTHISVVDIYSYGMLFAIVLDISAYDLAKECFNKGIIIEAINSRTIKISPPYFMGKEAIDKLINVFDNLLDKLAKHDRLC